MATVAVIKTNGDIEFVKIRKGESQLSDMQKIVGGNISYFPHPKGNESSLYAIGNDEGMLIPLPRNNAASTIIQKLGFYRRSDD